MLTASLRVQQLWALGGLECPLCSVPALPSLVGPHPSLGLSVLLQQSLAFSLFSTLPVNLNDQATTGADPSPVGPSLAPVASCTVHLAGSQGA